MSMIPVNIPWDTVYAWCRDVSPLLNGMYNNFYGRPTGIYGEPRGGLPIAVTLSHFTNLPLILDLDQHLKDTKGPVLWVDDVIDTGHALKNAYRRLGSDHYYLALHVKERSKNLLREREAQPSFMGWWPSLVVPNNYWLIYPWEDGDKALEDYEDYCRRRGEES